MGASFLMTHTAQMYLGHHFELGQLAEFASPDNRKVMHVNASSINEGDDLANHITLLPTPYSCIPVAGDHISTHRH